MTKDNKPGGGDCLPMNVVVLSKYMDLFLQLPTSHMPSKHPKTTNMNIFYHHVQGFIRTQYSQTE